ncbi:MAG: HEAT repeat domain-containing protein [Polyangiaceae bacterium]
MSGLLSTSRHLRRHAFDRLALDRDSAYAARELLANDEDAGVRARAARFLGGAPDEIAVPALIDALDDAAPLVRHAAARALAAARVSAAGRAEIHRLAIEDPIWWVRRAAVVTAATRDASAALPTLRAALEDPFWRVRAAAVRALVALGEADDALLERLGPATTDRSSGALGYLARRLGDASRPSGPVAEPPRIPGQPDPDPAVAAARVARGDAVASAFLVECLGDAHASLRAAARKRLTRARDPRALELALLWLDEPRIPHAAETVVELLDGLDRPRADHVLDVAFERGGPGAVCWAASYVGLTRDASREGALLALARAELPIVRSAVIAALGDLGGERARAAIATALSDPAPRVVRIAAHAAFALEMFDELASVDAPADAPTRRVLASLAARRADPDAVDRFSRDPDPRVRAIAVGAMNAAERALLCRSGSVGARREPRTGDGDGRARARSAPMGAARRVPLRARRRSSSRASSRAERPTPGSRRARAPRSIPRRRRTSRPCSACLARALRASARPPRSGSSASTRSRSTRHSTASWAARPRRTPRSASPRTRSAVGASRTRTSRDCARRARRSPRRCARGSTTRSATTRLARPRPSPGERRSTCRSDRSARRASPSPRS